MLGSPRSGTTLLYDMLLSAGGFAVYLAESNVFNLLAPRFGDLSERRNRERAVRAWLTSKLFRATGLDADGISAKLLDECRNTGDFLRIVMEEIALLQGAQRWAENSPEAMLHLPAIKRFIPDALVVHIVRDGRDVAMSLGKVRYVRPFPWERNQSRVAAGVYWEWMVRQGRTYGKALGPDYLEVHFEDLIADPRATLTKVAGFIEHDLDYERIVRVGYGSVSNPNTSFSGHSTDFNPVGRWKHGLAASELRRLEAMVGPTLQEFGYPLSRGERLEPMSVELRAERAAHLGYIAAKQWFKRNRLLRSLRPQLTSEEIDQTVLADDHAPRLHQPDSVAITAAGDSSTADPYASSEHGS